MTRSEVFSWLMMKGQSSEQRLMEEFGRGVQEIISSLRDLGLVCIGQNRNGTAMLYPVEL